MASVTTSDPPQERQGAITLKGNPVTLVGPQIQVGMKAPNFQVIAHDSAPVTLADSKGNTRLISVVHSVDTGICDAQTRRFNQEAAKLPGVEILTISMDLPFALKRWCGAAGVDKVKVLSDHREASFGRAYGVLIKEARLLARALFVIDPQEVVRYVEYVPEVGSHPNYDAALAAARQSAKAV